MSEDKFRVYRLAIAFFIVIFIIPLCVILFFLLPDVLFPGNRRGVAQFDDYRIEVIPHYYDDFEKKDSCLFVITDIKESAIKDTLVFYPGQYTGVLRILVSDNYKWTLVYDARDVRYTSHFIEWGRKNRVELDGVKDVLAFDELYQYSCVQLLRYQIDSSPPYYSEKLYRSRRIKFKKTMKEICKTRVGKRNLEWHYTDIYNYLLISDEKGIVIDTLRWYRNSLGNSWEFLMVGDTIVLDNHYSCRPICSSPLVVRHKLDLTSQFPRGFKESASMPGESRYPATLVEFKDDMSFFAPYRGEISVSKIYLPSSPLEGIDVTDSFMKENVFLIREE